MPKGISIHIGLNEVSSYHYGGWSGKLNACVADANSMRGIAGLQGFQTITLLDSQATREECKKTIQSASDKLDEDDILLLTYSGHGGQLPDRNGDESDHMDETWCLYDGQLLDDELCLLFANFRSKTRIVVLSDSCHSGTVVRMTLPSDTKLTTDKIGFYDGAVSKLLAETINSSRYRAMPRDIALKVYTENKKYYDSLISSIPVAVDPRGISARVLLISGCQDNQLSADGTFNGAFTEQIISVWDNGKFSGSYRELHKLTAKGLPPTQSPNLFTMGKSARSLIRARAFAI